MLEHPKVGTFRPSDGVGVLSGGKESCQVALLMHERQRQFNDGAIASAQHIHAVANAQNVMRRPAAEMICMAARYGRIQGLYLCKLGSSTIDLQ